MAIGGPLLEKLWHTAMISLKFPHRKLPGLCLYYDFLPEAATGSYFFLLCIYKYLFQKQRKQCFPLSSLLNRVCEEANRPWSFSEKIYAWNHSDDRTWPLGYFWNNFEIRQCLRWKFPLVNFQAFVFTKIFLQKQLRAVLFSLYIKFLFQKQRGQCFPLSSLLNRVFVKASRPCPFSEKI